MAHDVYHYVEECPNCRRDRRHATHQRLPQLSPPDGSLEFVTTDILGPLPETKFGNRFVVVITDRFSKLIREILTKEETTAHIAEIFLDARIMPYEIPERPKTTIDHNLLENSFMLHASRLGHSY